MMKKTLFVFAAAALLCAPATLGAQQKDEWTAQVRKQLRAAGAELEKHGYELTHHIYTGALDDGDDDTVEFELEIGAEYQIVGVCDTDCSDLDLTIFDTTGKEIDSDDEDDDAPIVTAEPRRTGRYRVVVSMAACSAEPCRYGIGIFGK